MADLKQLEFFLLRYVPDAVKEEFVNIGLLMREVGGGEPGFSAVRITEDWSRVRCIDPEADLEVLTGLGLQLQKELRETQGWDLVLRKVQDLFSNQVQASPAKACLAEDAAKELATLTKLYLQGRRGTRRVGLSGRQVILRGMESALSTAGVLELMRREVGVTEYTRKKGDPQSFDFAYALAAEVKFLHAVSLKTDVKIGLGLAARFPGIAKDIYEVHKAQAKLTVVVDDDLDRGVEEIGFAIGMMEENRIRVAAAGEMAGIAAEVRAELRA